MTARRTGRQRATSLQTAVVAVVTAAVVLAPIVVSTSTSGTMQLKAALVVSLALIGIALTVVLAVVRQQLTWPWGFPAAAGAVFLAALILAALTAPVTILAILGAPLRLSGLATYAASLALFFIVLMHFSRKDAERTALWMLVPVAVTVIVGALQVLPVSVAFIGPNAPMRGLLGNTNFASALLGMSVPLSVWAALAAKPSRAFRPLALALAVGAFMLAFLSGSIQGPIVAAVGLLPLIVAYGLNRGGRIRTTAFATAAGGIAAGIVGAYGLLTTRGPLGWLASYASVGPRMWYWEAALNMASEHPMRGVGLGMYGHMYTQYRSVESVRDLPVGVVADDAHSIPLHLLAEGGLPLVGVYALFAAAVLVTCLIGLRRLDGGDRLMLGGIAGATLAYFTQGLISIEVAGLMPVGFVLAGLAVVAAATDEKSYRRARGVGSSSDKHARNQKEARQRTVVASVLVLSVLAPLLFTVWIPYRADVHAETARRLEAAGEVDAALREAQTAVHLFPVEARNYLPLVTALGETGNTEAGLNVLEEARTRDPFNRTVVGGLARATSALYGMDEAQRYWDQLIELDPLGVVTHLDAAEAAHESGSLNLARELAQQAIDLRPDHVPSWERLLDICAELEDASCINESLQMLDSQHEDSEG